MSVGNQATGVTISSITGQDLAIKSIKYAPVITKRQQGIGTEGQKAF